MRLSASSLEGLFIQAAKALAELMADRPSEIQLENVEDVTLEGRDPEALLVNWLDELIYLADTQQKVFPQVDTLKIDFFPPGTREIGTTPAGNGGRLTARIRGGPPQVFKTSVKAATFHDLEVRVGPEGASAAVILDV